jgi:hypothetical protein
LSQLNPDWIWKYNFGLIFKNLGFWDVEVASEISMRTDTPRGHSFLIENFIILRWDWVVK